MLTLNVDFMEVTMRMSPDRTDSIKYVGSSSRYLLCYLGHDILAVLFKSSGHFLQQEQIWLYMWDLWQ